MYYYNTSVRPIEKQMIEKLLECLPIFYSFHKNPHPKLSKHERVVLKDLIQSLLCQVCEYHMPSEISSEIRCIIEDIEGIDFAKEISQEFSHLKEDAIRFATENGINIDLSKMSEHDTTNELIDKLREAMHEGMKNKVLEENIQEKSTSSKKKTKRQIEKEQKVKDLLEIQKKGLTTIYKQLAKIFHPDLEQNLNLKIEKEALMKKLTTAYENQDLHTLLAIEIEWMNRSTSGESKALSSTDEQLSIYNILLKDQEKSLNQELHFISDHPKYFNMNVIIEGSHSPSIIGALKDRERTLLLDINRYAMATRDLQEKDGVKKLKEILKEFSTPMIDDILLMMKNLF